MANLIKEKGQIHKRLVANRCPKCNLELTYLGRTEDSLMRKCSNCGLKITDPLSGGEFPGGSCDTCED